MGIKIAGVDIAKEVAKALPTGSLPVATLYRIEYAQIDPTDPTADPDDDETSHGTRGIKSSSVGRAGTPEGTSLRLDRDAEILLLADPLNGVVPKPNDRIEIEGEKWRITTVDRDPAAATYVCRCRPW